VWATFQLCCLALNLWVVIRNVVTAHSGLTVFIIEPDRMSQHLLLNNAIGVFIAGGRRASPVVVLALLESGLLMHCCCRLVWQLVQALTSRHEVNRWLPFAIILWDVIPDLGSFSAMNSLHYVAPKIFIPSFTRRARLLYEKRDWKRIRDLGWFLSTRACAAFIGFEGFMIKFVMASEQFRSAASFSGALFVSAAFLNQMMGVVDINKFAQKRLFTFIFGGEDSFVSPDEMKVAQAWQARLVMHLWQTSKCHTPSWAWFLAVSLAYGDTDFQKLTLTKRYSQAVKVFADEDV